MAEQVLNLQWVVASVAVPIAIGIGSSLATHSLAVRKARLDLRLSDRRRSYGELLPALADVVAYDQREVRMAYQEFDTQQSEDRAHALDEEWKLRHDQAMSVIREVVAKREIAASPNVLKALDGLLADYASVGPETHSWNEACEEFAVSSLKALDAVRKEIAREA